jgi:ribonucleoside-diphosphate reductase alpha chain
MKQYQEFIHQSRYARWLDDLGRRETWDETVDRYCDFMDVPSDTREAVRRRDVMPSMRAMWSAGPALERCHVAGYNCSALLVDSPRAFDEAIYILMSGCGLGFSVERQFIAELPEVPRLAPAEGDDEIIVVEDSREGWASAYRRLVSMLYMGHILPWDLRQLRPAGAKLKTFGGRSSGPDPLDSLFRFTVDTFMNAQGRKLNSIECHDLMCKIGEVVVAGGVRRSALISLSNPSDDRMRKAKHGAWWQEEPQRALANNSAAYTERPDFEVFMAEWLALYESKCGERGLFNRQAAKAKAKRYCREENVSWITNPCSEISLRPMQTCNLSEVVVRASDTRETLLEKVRHATILGTLQSALTDFKYLRPEWKKNCEEERLLGVSLTGIMDHHIMSRPQAPLREWLEELREMAVSTNAEWAEKLGIGRSRAITTVKPSGTVSQLCDSSSGIHPRFSRYYIRRVRQAETDPLTRMLIDQGVPHERDKVTPTNIVFEFPIKAPADARCNLTALEQCQLWKMYNDHWAEHSVSCTVYYTQDEFLGLGDWVWRNFDSITGLSFLPKSDHSYQQAPYEAITSEEYDLLVHSMPDIDWSKLAEYETEDNTSGAQTLACVGGSCEI